MTYQKGTYLVYGSSGVCRVEDVGPMAGGGSDRAFYTLRPVFGSGLIYVPVDTGIFMRPVLSRERVEELIDRLPQLDGTVCSGASLRTLTEHYHAAFESHSCEELLRLIKSIHQKGEDSQRQGRRLGATDQKYRRQAEELIHGEFSVALGIPVEEVPEYISARLAQVQADA